MARWSFPGGVVTPRPASRGSGEDRRVPVRRALILVAASFATLLLSSASSGADVAAGSGSPGALTWRTAASPFRIDFVRDGRVVARHAPGAAAKPGTRLGYWLADGTVRRLTGQLAAEPVAGGTAYTVATDEPGRSARVTVTRTSRGLSVALQLIPNSGVAGIYEAFAAERNEHFLGTGERGQYVDLRGQIVPLKIAYDCASTIVTPFYLSSRGYGIYLETSAVGHIEFAGHHDGPACSERSPDEPPLCRLGGRSDRVELCVKASELSYEVYAGTPEQIVRAYTARTGRPALPPPEQLALVKWRDEVSGERELLDDISQLQRRGIPLGWILLDNPWEAGGCKGTLSFDSSRFPDPARTIAAVRARDVRLMLWISPLVTRRADCPYTGYDESVLIAGDAQERQIDLTSRAARELFVQRLRGLVLLGVDGVKADRGDQFDLEDDRLAGGEGITLHNRYPTLYAQAVAEAFRAAGRRVAGMFRAGYAGSQRAVPAVWAGDQESSFAGLSAAIRMGQTASVSGFPIWGSDIGGYHRGFRNSAPDVTPELLVRWAQFAAVTPLFEVGGIGRNARFWELGTTATELFRRSAVLHYELAPYLYQRARAAHSTGSPILRPLGFSFPYDEQAWTHDLEFLVGPDLLAAPASSSGRRVDVYLPKGEWVDLERGGRLKGPLRYERTTPLDELPLYLRAGAAIPFDFRTPDVWADPWRANDLLRAGRAGWLYAPGGSVTAAVSNEAGRLRAVSRGDTLTLSFSAAPRELQALVLTRAKPLQVTIGGRVVPAARSLAELRRSREGWTRRTDGPFAGVVLKLAPAAGAAVAAIDLGPVRSGDIADSAFRGHV